MRILDDVSKKVFFCTKCRKYNITRSYSNVLGGAKLVERHRPRDEGGEKKERRDKEKDKKERREGDKYR